jgi:ABC-type nitrate/sulfonate/bicarbonate transport system substrate-binding protein
MNKKYLAAALMLLTLLLPSCKPTEQPTSAQAPVEITLILDWVPNTNHTGIFVAQEKGYFAEENLNVHIIQPGEVYAEQAIATGIADFGVSFQEQVTLSRASTEPAPLVSIAAIIQHNTSGFAALEQEDIKSPKDFEGLQYGSYGSPFEAPTLRMLMQCAGGDFEKLQIIDVGYTEPLGLLSTDKIDLAWIFYGWQGIQAEEQGLGINILMMSDYFNCIPDYYTPILITNEKTISERPEVVRAFLKAVSRGYQFAIQNPDAAASILLRVAPELEETLVHKSQSWLSPQYQADASRWGEQKTEVWQNYSQWMVDNGIITHPIDTQAIFTNEFLP